MGLSHPAACSTGRAIVQGRDDDHLLFRLSLSPEIIQHAVWIYLRFTLSYRDVEELLAERGIVVSHETVRRWVIAFGPRYARRLQAVRCKPNSDWHLDEMFVSIGGKRMYLWRAVDAEGEVLDILVQARRDQRAAQSLMRKLLRKFGMSPSSVVTDRLPFYGAALSELGLSKKHVQGRRTNNRVESSHVPIHDENARRKGSSRPGQRSASCPLTPPSTTPSTPAAISFPPTRIENSGRRPSLHGARLSA